MPQPSGHSFHFETEDKIKGKGWEITSKPSYIDDVTLKPREIDFIASRKGPSYNPRGNQLALVVECKYLAHDVVSWHRPNPKDRNGYFVDGYLTSELLNRTESFHYLSPASVSVEIEERSQKPDLKEAVFQATKALIYFRQSSQILYTKGLFFPVVIYKGPGKIVDQTDRELKNLLHYHQYAWKNPKTGDIKSYSAYVDIIHESYLEQYLDKIYTKEMDDLMSHVFFYEQMNRKRLGHDPRDSTR